MFLVISLQIRLRQRIQQDIITDLRTPDKLKESLDVVDIVLGLLSSGGASDDVRLEKYILSTKMGNKPFSAKVSNRDMYLLCLKLLIHTPRLKSTARLVIYSPCGRQSLWNWPGSCGILGRNRSREFPKGILLTCQLIS